MVQGALSELVEWGKYVSIVWNAVDTAMECYSSGADVGSCLLAAALSILTSLSFIPECDLLTDILVDLTFGLGGSLVSSGVSAAIQSNASTKGVLCPDSDASNTTTTKENQGTVSRPRSNGNISPPPSNPWKPCYNGFGWVYYQNITNGGYQIPPIGRTFRIN